MYTSQVYQSDSDGNVLHVLEYQKPSENSYKVTKLVGLFEYNGIEKKLESTIEVLVTYYSNYYRVPLEKNAGDALSSGSFEHLHFTPHNGKEIPDEHLSDMESVFHTLRVEIEKDL